MKNGVIPQLDVNQPIIESKSDKLTYILKFLSYNPGWTSSWYDEKLLSMRRIMAKYTEDSYALVPALKQFLEEAVRHFYPDYSVDINIMRDPSNPANYSMDISIKDAAGNVAISLDRITKDDSGVFIWEGVPSQS